MGLELTASRSATSETVPTRFVLCLGRYGRRRAGPVRMNGQSSNIKAERIEQRCAGDAPPTANGENGHWEAPISDGGPYTVTPETEECTRGHDIRGCRQAQGLVGVWRLDGFHIGMMRVDSELNL